MDTDDFSEMAVDIIVPAAQTCDTLKAELGAMARFISSEDQWLQDACDLLEEIIEEPKEYIEFWDLEKWENLSAPTIFQQATELCSQIDTVLATPMDKRGVREW